MELKEKGQTFLASCLKAFLTSYSDESGRILRVLYGSITEDEEEQTTFDLLSIFVFFLLLFFNRNDEDDDENDDPGRPENPFPPIVKAIVIFLLVWFTKWNQRENSEKIMIL